MIRRTCLPIVGIALLASGFCAQSPRAHAESIVVLFTEFAVGTTFPNASLPTTIVANGANVALSKYNDSASANASIIDLPLNPGKALFLAGNLRADILLPAPATDGFFYFRDDGGTNLLEINGQTLSFADPRLAGPGSVIDTFAGVTFHSYSNTPQSPEYRSVKIFGNVTSLSFIGQELTLGYVALSLVPEPSTWALLTAGAISASTWMGCRHKKRWVRL